MEKRKTKAVFGRLLQVISGGTIVIKPIWNVLVRRTEKQVWRLMGFPGQCPLKLSLNCFEQNIKKENTNSVETDSSSKSVKTIQADKRRVMVDKIRWFKNVLRFKRRIDKTLWWGDNEGACPTTQSLRAIDLHAKDFLKTFFRKELEATTRCFSKTSFLPSLIILDAEINAIRKANERRQAEKQARFMKFIRANQEKR